MEVGSVSSADLEVPQELQAAVNSVSKAQQMPEEALKLVLLTLANLQAEGIGQNLDVVV